MDSGPHLVGGDQPHTLGEPGETVGIDLVRPALRQCGVEQGADRLGVRALRTVGCDAAQGGVHGEAADPVLAGRAPQYRARGEPQMREALAVRGRHGLGYLADQLVGVVSVHRTGGQQSRELSGVGEPFVDDIDEVVLLDRVEYLHETRVPEQRGGPGAASTERARGWSAGSRCTPTARRSFSSTARQLLNPSRRVTHSSSRYRLASL